MAITAVGTSQEPVHPSGTLHMHHTFFCPCPLLRFKGFQAYAAALARQTLGRLPRKVDVQYIANFIDMQYKYQVAEEGESVYNRRQGRQYHFPIKAPWQQNNIRDAVPYK